MDGSVHYIHYSFERSPHFYGQKFLFGDPRYKTGDLGCLILVFSEIDKKHVCMSRVYLPRKMHSSRMHTACSSSRPGGSPPGTWEQAPPLPGSRHHPPPPPWSRLPLEQASPPPPVDRMTDACENITLRAVITNDVVSLPS